MEDNRKNTGNGKVITANFGTDTKNQAENPVNVSSNQSNPILNRLFKLTHTELIKNKENYKSFSKFKPEDLR